MSISIKPYGVTAYKDGVPVTPGMLALTGGGGGEQEVFTAVITKEVGRLVCDMTASEIINADRKGIVKAEYTDDATNETRAYYYAKQMPDGRAAFSKDGYIEDGVPKQTIIYVDYAGNVTIETREPTVDAELNDKSEFPVQNKVITTAVRQLNESKADKSYVDNSIAALGTVFDYKGSKPSKSDLPADGNTPGDVWYVEDESTGYIWLEEGRWEAFGPAIDLSGYATNSALKQVEDKIPQSAYKDAQDGGYSGTEPEFKTGLSDAVSLFEKDSSGWTPVVEVDGASVSWVKGKYWDRNGSLQETQYTAKYYTTPAKIKIYPNCHYTVKGLAGDIMLYDSTGANAVTIENSAPAQTKEFDTDSKRAYMCVNTTSVGSWTPQRVVVTRTTISQAEIDNLPANTKKLKNLFGKEVVCFGDSLFGMHRGDTSAPAYAANNCGATVYNVGFGGCWMSLHPEPGYVEFSMCKLADAVVSGDWSAQDAATGVPAYFKDQLAILKAIDFQNVYACVIHYGTNDWFPPYPASLDNPENIFDQHTMCGSLRYSIKTLQTKFPNLQIFVSVPCYRTWTSGGGEVTTSDTKVNAKGIHLYDVGKGYAKVAKEYNLPVIDSYHGLNINKNNWSTYLEDGTHHNQTGRQRFGAYIGQCLMAATDGFGFYGSEEGGGTISSYPVVIPSVTSLEIKPNVFYKWGPVDTLNITFAPEISGYTSEYTFQFTSGSTPTKLIVPASVKWATANEIEANKTYQVSILNGIGVIAGA